jgi:hypothetical protein
MYISVYGEAEEAFIKTLTQSLINNEGQITEEKVIQFIEKAKEVATETAKEVVQKQESHNLILTTEVALNELRIENDKASNEVGHNKISIIFSTTISYQGETWKLLTRYLDEEEMDEEAERCNPLSVVLYLNNDNVYQRDVVDLLKTDEWSKIILHERRNPQNNNACIEIQRKQ